MWMCVKKKSTEIWFTKQKTQLELTDAQITHNDDDDDDDDDDVDDDDDDDDHDDDAVMTTTMMMTWG